MKNERVFDWDNHKNTLNIAKHGVSFEQAVLAFEDTGRLVKPDAAHSCEENRYFCFGKVNGCVMTVRFTLRGDVIRIIGAAYWRRGRKIYEKETT